MSSWFCLIISIVFGVYRKGMEIILAAGGRLRRRLHGRSMPTPIIVTSERCGSDGFGNMPFVMRMTGGIIWIIFTIILFGIDWWHVLGIGRGLLFAGPWTVGGMKKTGVPASRRQLLGWI
jgi:hypothetical protein